MYKGNPIKSCRRTGVIFSLLAFVSGTNYSHGNEHMALAICVTSVIVAVTCFWTAAYYAYVLKEHQEDRS